MSDRPNIILCLCDQMRAQAVGCYGNDLVRTPNLDRLATAGVRFETAVSNAPLCTPARSAILAGQYARTCTGMLNNTTEDPPPPRRIRLTDPTLAEILRDGGYRTELIGKWHIDPPPEHVGFDHAVFPQIPHHHYGQRYFETGRDEFTVNDFTPVSR